MVWVAFDPEIISYGALLAVFFENHNPTQACDKAMMWARNIAPASIRTRMLKRLKPMQHWRPMQSDCAAGFGAITTGVIAAGPLYYAEDYHQQYLAKVPDGYCGLGGTGVLIPSEQEFSLSDNPVWKVDFTHLLLGVVTLLTLSLGLGLGFTFDASIMGALVWMLGVQILTPAVATLILLAVVIRVVAVRGVDRSGDSVGVGRCLLGLWLALRNRADRVANFD